MGRLNKLLGNEAAVVAEHLQGKTMSYLAEKYGVKVGTIQYTLTKCGAIRKVVNDVAGKRDQIVSDYLNGMSRREIAQKYKNGDSTLLRFLSESGRSMRPYEESNRKRSLDVSFFDVINNEPKAYFLGLLYADGCVSDGLNRTNSIRLALKETDKHIIEAFREAIGSDAPIHVYKNKGGYKPGSVAASFQIYCKRMRDSLEGHGCGPRKSLTCTFPTSIPEHLMSHFLRGYVDGDGWIKVYSHSLCAGMIGSIPFIESVASYLSEKLNIIPYLRLHHKSKDVMQLEFGGGNKIRTLLNFLYSDATIYLNRKKVTADEIISRKYYSPRNIKNLKPSV